MFRIPLMRVAAAAAIAAFSVGAMPAQAQELPSLSIDPNAVSVSGLSSGAFMTSQLQVAYSATFMGSGVVAGGPYGCAMGNMAYTAICMGLVPFVPPNASLMYAAAETASAIGTIDKLDNLKSKKIYIFSGTADTVVKQNAVDATYRFFQLAGVPAAQVKYVKDYPAGHSFVSPIFGSACSANQGPYINECPGKDGTDVTNGKYDQAEALLTHIYGKLNPPAQALKGKLMAFDQDKYGGANPMSSMAKKGHVFVPAECTAAGANCRLHVSIHGCGQSEESVGDDWYTKLYMNEWADTNKIVVVYPQVNKSSVMPLNPAGCWDWWGYSGINYAVKGAVQMDGIMKMIAKLSGT